MEEEEQWTKKDSDEKGKGKKCLVTVSKPTRHCRHPFPVCLSAFLNRASGLVMAAPAFT